MGCSRKKRLIAALLSLCATIAVLQPLPAQEGMILRIFGRAGATLNPPSAPDLGHSGGDYDDISEYSVANYGGGVQISYPKGSLRIGGEAGLTRIYSLTLDFSLPVIDDRTVDSSSFLNLCLFAEWPITDFLFLQAGGGIYVDLWHYVEYINGKAKEDVDYGGWDLVPGAMTAAGAEFPIAPDVSLFAMARLDAVFTWGVCFPFSVAFGASIRP